MTLTSLTSTLAGLTAGLAVFNSGFLIVTEAFDCTEAVFTLASDKFFFVGVTVALVSFGAAARTALGAVLALEFFAGAAVAAFTGDFTAFTAVIAALPEGLAAVVFFGNGRVAARIDAVAGLALPALELVLALFTEGFEVGFFIAFTIESTAK